MTRRPAIVTGASSGIGAACAVALAAAGHPVVLGARRVDRCEAIAASIREMGGEALACRLDVTVADDVVAFVAAAQEAVGAIDVVVSVAGDVLPTRAADTDPVAFAAQVDVNLLAVQRLVAAVAPGMIERRRGDIAFITSDVVRVPRPHMSSYVTSKWGLEGLARAMQMELEGTGVRASIVRPGPTLTEMGSTWDADAIGAILDEWTRWGLMRHDGYLPADGVAGAVLAVINAPRGTHFTLVEVEPEAPVRA
jgi:NADP-dependent 3-hydroxy acid dehydrogenase YdfG